MKNEKPIKKGLFGLLREAFSKTGGCCCGPGETCGGPGKAGGKDRNEDVGKTKTSITPGAEVNGPGAATQESRD